MGRNGYVSLSLACLSTLLCLSMSAQVAVTTFQYDNSRTGANTHETILNPTNVNVSQFGLKKNFQVQGQVYAQPLYVPNLNIGGVAHNTLFVVTQHDQAYAFDVDSGKQLWHTSFWSVLPSPCRLARSPARMLKTAWISIPR